MKKIIIGVVLIIALVMIFSSLNEENTEQVSNSQDNNVISDVPESAESLENPDVAVLAGAYNQYDGNLEQYEGNSIVLFFKASWCPSCRTLDRDIKSNLNDIPENVVLLELDYDTETELKKKYGVTTQHTLVQVDTTGEMIKKWSGGNRLEDVLNQIN